MSQGNIMAVSRSGPRLAILLFLLGLFGFADSPTADAQDIPFVEAVKAAQLYKFASFVTWPAGALGADRSPLRICVVDDAKFAAAVNRATRNRTLNGHPYQVRTTSADDLGDCHVVFLPGSEPPSVVSNVLSRLVGHPVLTVTDGAASDAGIINFVIRDGRVRFEIDNATAQRGGLAINAQLLALAASQSSR